MGTNGLEPSTSRLSGVRSNHLSYAPFWWRWGGSNSWPPACKAGALPAELHPHVRVSLGFSSFFFCRHSFSLSILKIEQCFLSTCSPLLTEAFELSFVLLRKEVIQPHLPIRLPCYDFTPVINPTLDGVLPKVRRPALGVTDSHGVTGGVYKARERIHRSMLICDY